VLVVAGTGLITPAVGVEVFAMPVIGRLYLEGGAGVAPALASIYRGPMTVVMIVGLLMVALGAIELARAIRQDGGLPGWGGVILAIGLTLWLPLLPRPVRILDGLMLGLGGIGLAWAIWRRGATAVR